MLIRPLDCRFESVARRSGGGCISARRKALERIGGFAAIRGE